MENKSMEKVKESAILPKCLCNVELPHTAEHAQQIPQLVMPTVKLQESVNVTRDDRQKRILELLTNPNSARKEDIELKEKFETKAKKLMEELKNIFNDSEEADDILTNDAMVESGDMLKYQLEHSRFQLAEARNQLHSLKKELSIYRKLVQQEVNPDMDLHALLTSKDWKGRAEEINRLKSEIAEMESKAYAHKYVRNPLCIPEYQPRFPRVEDLIPRRQAEYLKKEAARRKEIEKEKDDSVSALMHEYGDIALMYKASVTHNKSLAEELRALKSQLEVLESRAKEEQEIIKKLTTHQMQMTELLDREAHLKQLVQQKEQKEAKSEKERELDTLKYKTLWEASEYQKQSLLEMMELLTSRLEHVMGKTENAEKHYKQNQERQNELEKMVEDRKAAMKDKTKKKEKGNKKTDPQKASIAAQLEAVQEENEFLKNFLQKEIELKGKDMELYKLTMSNLRHQYLEAIKKLKDKKNQEKSAAPTKN